MAQDDEYLHRRAMAEGQSVGASGRGGKKKRGGWRRVLWRLLLWAVVMGLVFAGLGYGLLVLVLGKYSRYAEEFNLEDVNNLDHPSIIYDCKGREIGRIFDENRSYVAYKDISRSMIDALVAQEDKNFWTHEGYDLWGIARAAKEAGFSPGQANQGASTITQQLARNAYDLERRTLARGGTRYERKVVEIFLARRLEKRYSKRQIIEFYLNRIYFGRGYYGIRAASLGYFGKEPRELTVRESASLAALVKNPENYNPVKNPELNLRWRNDVVDRMQRLGMVGVKEAERVKEQPLGLNPAPLRRHTSFLHALVQREVVGLFESPERGEEVVRSRGLRIYTTIDAEMQAAAEGALQRQLKEIEGRADYKHVRHDDAVNPRADRHRYLDGAVYAVDNASGATRVYVAGRDFERDNFDIIEDGRRPMGTALLPFLYMCAFDNGYSPCSRLVDDAMDNRLAGIGGSKGILGEWGMEVAKGRYMDSITARQALEWSKIAAAARLGIELSARSHRGAKVFVDTLTKVGIEPPMRNEGSTEAHPEYYPRVYLGTEPVSLKEMVMAYTVLPNLGKRAVKPYVVTKVVDREGHILWENPLHVDGRSVRATSACTAFRLHNILQESLKEGAAVRMGQYMPTEFHGAVKTGTNYDFADATAFGYTSGVTCGVWVGFLNEHQAIYAEAFATDVCGPILGEVMKVAVGRYADEQLMPPEGVESVEICKYSGQVATNFCYESTEGKVGYTRPTYVEYFAKGDVSLSSCSVHGDGSPSLGDLLDTRGQNTFSRVLPVAPILPKGLALVGEDPYGCRLTLNPKYRDVGDGTGGTQRVNEEDALPAEEADEVEEPVKVDSSIELRMPSPLRYLPTGALQL